MAWAGRRAALREGAEPPFQSQHQLWPLACGQHEGLPGSAVARSVFATGFRHLNRAQLPEHCELPRLSTLTPIKMRASTTPDHAPRLSGCQASAHQQACLELGVWHHPANK